MAALTVKDHDEGTGSSLYQPVLVNNPERCLNSRVAFIAACWRLVGAENHLDMNGHDESMF